MAVTALRVPWAGQTSISRAIAAIEVSAHLSRATDTASYSVGRYYVRKQFFFFFLTSIRLMRIISYSSHSCEIFQRVSERALTNEL